MSQLSRAVALTIVLAAGAGCSSRLSTGGSGRYDGSPGPFRVEEGGELLDPPQSRAFAIADHQVAHVYVEDRHDMPRVSKPSMAWRQSGAKRKSARTGSITRARASW